MVHIFVIHALKAQIFVYLLMYGRSQPDLTVRKNDFHFFIQDFSHNITFIIWKVHEHVHKIHLEGTVSQNFKIGLSKGDSLFQK